MYHHTQLLKAFIYYCVKVYVCQGMHLGGEAQLWSWFSPSIVGFRGQPLIVRL